VAGFPFARTDASCDFSDGNAGRGEAVQDGDTDLELGNLTVKVPSGQALAPQFQTMDPGFDAAFAVVAAPSIARHALWSHPLPRGVARGPDRSVLMRAGLRFARSPPPCQASTALRFLDAALLASATLVSVRTVTREVEAARKAAERGAARLQRLTGGIGLRQMLVFDISRKGVLSRAGQVDALTRLQPNALAQVTRLRQREEVSASSGLAFDGAS